MWGAVSGFVCVFELFVMSSSDLGFKTSERSGDDVSWRNGTNIPRRRPRGGVQPCGLELDDSGCDDMGLVGCGA